MLSVCLHWLCSSKALSRSDPCELVENSCPTVQCAEYPLYRNRRCVQWPWPTAELLSFHHQCPKARNDLPANILMLSSSQALYAESNFTNRCWAAALQQFARQDNRGQTSTGQEKPTVGRVIEDKLRRYCSSEAPYWHPLRRTKAIIFLCSVIVY